MNAVTNFSQLTAQEEGVETMKVCMTAITDANDTWFTVRIKLAHLEGVGTSRRRTQAYSYALQELSKKVGQL